MQPPVPGQPLAARGPLLGVGVASASFRLSFGASRGVLRGFCDFLVATKPCSCPAAAQRGHTDLVLEPAIGHSRLICANSFAHRA